MADMQARREARRRKILQNSENRLKLITGEHNGPINAINSVDISNERNQHIQSKHEENDVRLENRIGNHANDYNRTEFSEQLLTEVSNVEPNTSKASYISSKIYISFLAVFIRLLYIFNLQCYIQNSIVLPFVIAKASLLFLQNDLENHTILSTLLIFSNISPNQLRYIGRIMNIAVDVMRDFFLYYFIFVIFNICLEIVVLS